MPDFPPRGYVLIEQWNRPDVRSEIGSCLDCGALVAIPDQSRHVDWHLRTGAAIARAAQSTPTTDTATILLEDSATAPSGVVPAGGATDG